MSKNYYLLLLQPLKNSLRYFWIDGNRVVSIALGKSFRVRINGDHFAFLIGHVTPNAMLLHRGTDFLDDSTLLRLMTSHAFLGKLRQVSLFLVYIVASRAGHFVARREAPTKPKQSDLVAVYIGAGVFANGVSLQILCQRLTRSV